MKACLQTKRFLRTGTCLLGLLLAVSARAYPPAPHHLFYGLVRDEFGGPLQDSSAVVILETTSGVTVKAQVIPGLEPGVNYSLAVPMDSGITDDLYKPTALRPMVPFKIRVKVGNTFYLPMELKGDYSQMGQPGKRTHLDLTLGEDSDGDGLPDAWERILLALAGNGKTLADIRPEDDFDGDGLSNLDEYVAGTYAFDSKDGFTLKVLGAEADVCRLEFMVITGRSYTLLGSPDLTAWLPVEFRLATDTPEASPWSYYYATDVRVLRVDVVPAPDRPSMRFFRVMVR